MYVCVHSEALFVIRNLLRKLDYVLRVQIKQIFPFLKFIFEIYIFVKNFGEM